jgi:hypothetical protein
MDPLYDLLLPYLDPDHAHSRSHSHSHAPDAAYLARLTTLPLAALAVDEPHALAQQQHHQLRQLQTLSKRSHAAIVAATNHLDHLPAALTHIARDAAHVNAALPALDSAAARFAAKYANTPDSELLLRRRRAMLLARNADRLVDVLDLPSLLSSAIAASSAATTPNYASALDLDAHIRRLHALYPHSPLVAAIAAQAESEMKAMAATLVAALHAPSIKLAAAMRTIGWLRRVAPDLADHSTTAHDEGSLGALFLVCRLSALESTLAALAPLRDLADQETARRTTRTAPPDAAWAAGQQTEKYLKKYLEVFREQSFAIVSMFKSIFPAALPVPDDSNPTPTSTSTSAPTIPSSLSTFPAHLVDLLFATLRTYLPNVQDKPARDSLLTQVLYAAASLGRLGADFGLMIALLEDELREQVDAADEAGAPKQEEEEEGGGGEEEWVAVMKKHRVQASRLDLLASGVGVAGAQRGLPERAKASA